jgi:hypothetical protein
MLVMEIGCAGRKSLISQLNTVNTAQRKPGCRHNVHFMVLVCESLSDNIQRGEVGVRVTVTKSSSSTLEEKKRYSGGLSSCIDGVNGPIQPRLQSGVTGLWANNLSEPYVI